MLILPSDNVTSLHDCFSTEPANRMLAKKRLRANRTLAKRRDALLLFGYRTQFPQGSASINPAQKWLSTLAYLNQLGAFLGERRKVLIHSGAGLLFPTLFAESTFPARLRESTGALRSPSRVNLGCLPNAHAPLACASQLGWTNVLHRLRMTAPEIYCTTPLPIKKTKFNKQLTPILYRERPRDRWKHRTLYTEIQYLERMRTNYQSIAKYHDKI